MDTMSNGHWQPPHGEPGRDASGPSAAAGGQGLGGVAGSGPQPDGPQPSGPGYQNPSYQNPGNQSPGDRNPGYRSSGYPSPEYQNPGQQNPGQQHPGGYAAPQAAPWPMTPGGPLLPPSARSRSPRRGRRGAAVALLAISCLLLGFGGGVLGAQVGAKRADVPTNSEIPIATSTITSRPADSVAGVAARVLPSTVSIEVNSGAAQGSGSGFVLRSDGLILTNNHVVAGAATSGEIRVIFSDGSQEPATIVGRTGAYDLAVLSVPRQNLPALPLGDSDAMVVGDPVIAIGAPLGLQSTVTTGIVSALHRPVVAGEDDDGNAFISAIQTDAAINPGNSGGPLVNAAGEVIGINSAIAATTADAEGSAPGNIGLGFAIPSNQAARTAEQLIATGKATYPVIGVMLDRDYTGQGVRVALSAVGNGAPVTPGGPADRAGIKPGDVIVGFEGRPVTAPDELIVGIRAQKPGDTVTLRVSSGGTERDVTLELSESESD